MCWHNQASSSDFYPAGGEVLLVSYHLPLEEPMTPTRIKRYKNGCCQIKMMNIYRYFSVKGVVFMYFTYICMH